jgi:hypothetical protein
MMRAVREEVGDVRRRDGPMGGMWRCIGYKIGTLQRLRDRVRLGGMYVLYCPVLYLNQVGMSNGGVHLRLDGTAVVGLAGASDRGR